MTIDEAIEEFRDAANTKADGLAPASRDHALHTRMVGAFACLTSFGSAGQTAFAALLHDESPHVRSWVAAQLLSTGDTSALPIMQQLAAQPGIQGFTAATTLKEFHAGRLLSPLATNVA